MAKVSNLAALGFEVIDGDRGTNYPKATDFSDSGHCLFLSAKNVTSQGFVFEERQFITKEKDQALRSGKLRRLDLVITTRGSIGNIAFYDERIPYDHLRINSGMVIVRGTDPKWIRYLFAVLRTQAIQVELVRRAHGSAQPALTVGKIESLGIPIPEDIEIDLVTEMVSAWDHAIDLHRRWINARKRFRAGLIENLLRKDYPEIKLESVIVDLVGGASIKTDQYIEAGLLVVSKKAANPSGSTILEPEDLLYCSEEFSSDNSKAVLDQTYLLTALRSLDAGNPQIGYVVRPPSGYDKFLIAQGAYGMKVNHEKIIPDFLVFSSSSRAYRSQVERKIVGGTQVHMRSGDFLSTTIKLPGITEQQAICEGVRSVDLEIELALKQLNLLTLQKRALIQRVFGGSQ